MEEDDIEVYIGPDLSAEWDLQVPCHRGPEVLGFDSDLLGVPAKTGRERELKELAQLLPRLGVAHRSRPHPAAPFPLRPGPEGISNSCQPAVTCHPPPLKGPPLPSAHGSRIPSFSFFFFFAEGEPGRQEKWHSSTKSLSPPFGLPRLPAGPWQFLLDLGTHLSPLVLYPTACPRLPGRALLPPLRLAAPTGSPAQDPGLPPPPEDPELTGQVLSSRHRPVRDTHLGARSSSRGQPGFSQLGRPLSLAAPGVPGRPSLEENGVTFEKKILGRGSQGLRSRGPSRTFLQLNRLGPLPLASEPGRSRGAGTGDSRAPTGQRSLTWYSTLLCFKFLLWGSRSPRHLWVSPSTRLLAQAPLPRCIPGLPGPSVVSGFPSTGPALVKRHAKLCARKTALGWFLPISWQHRQLPKLRRVDRRQKGDWMGSGSALEKSTTHLPLEKRGTVTLNSTRHNFKMYCVSLFHSHKPALATVVSYSFIHSFSSTV
ncbi:uncharacterized protein LOC135228638 [Loxodonta africana]|uniref:uncharacterized protein LOC135228638 n=1 Tax=Loxodonta africana TaxID=9785 RepID=UPI0030D37C31